MTIRYTNGQTFEAVLLSRAETTMRLAIQGHDDIVGLTLVHGTWVSDECEPVHVDFYWTARPAVSDVNEDDCLCSHEFAAHLIHLLYTGDDEVPAASPVPRSLMAAALHQVV